MAPPIAFRRGRFVGARVLPRPFGPTVPILLALALLAGLPALARQGGERPLLVTVDDLPLATGWLHTDPQERAAITRQLLGTLERHGIHAVGLVTWSNVRGPDDLALLALWLEAGHELGNHSFSHPDYNRTDADAYVADMERGRAELAGFLEPFDRTPRFFRFPQLHEGDTAAKLAAMREYLERSGQRNLPVTIDNPDYAFAEPWVQAQREGDAQALNAIGEEFQAALRLAVRHHERSGDALYGRPLPQILLLHATAVGAAQWDALFDWLERTGHRFAVADSVLADPVFEESHAFVGIKGYGLWDRFSVERLRREAHDEIDALLQTQARAWSRGDLPAFCAVYADDAVFVTADGIRRGREEILQRYRRRYVDRSAMGTLGLEIVELRTADGVEVSMLGDSRPSRIHGASVVARWTLSYPDREDASGLTLLVLRPTPEGWQIVQDASM